MRGDVARSDRALGEAEEHFVGIDRRNTTREVWGSHLGSAGLASYQGRAHYALARACRDPRAAKRAVQLLRHAVDNFGADYARPQAFDLANLAGSHALAGDTETALTVGHQAANAIMELRVPPARAHQQLRVLNGVLKPMNDKPGVAELCNRLTTTTA